VSEWAARLYPRLPVPLQNVACSLYGWREARHRLNADFERRLAWLMETERWSAGEIGAYQDEQVRGLIAHAYRNVPFYRERLDAAGLRPDDIRGVADLPLLPVLTKEEVRANAPRMLETGADPRKLRFEHTSGTTGKSLQFYLSPEALSFRWAVWWRHRQRFGVGVRDWHANFTGKAAVPATQTTPPFWRWNYPMRQVVLNMHHLVPANARAIVDFLDGQELVYYAGYPSVLHAFARSALEEGLSLAAPPRFVFTGAENLLDDQRRDIASLTGAVLTDQYGFSEGCGNASHCPELVYHEDFEFGVLECVDGEPGDAPGEVKGRIVATGFASRVFPFIRYEVGDVGVWRTEGPACPCGRQSRVLVRIEGRMDDYVVTPEGRRIMRFDYVFKDTQNVREAQVVQHREGEIEIRVVQRPGYSAGDEQTIRNEISAWISPALQVRFSYVPEIEREANGKFRAVRSRLPRAPRAD
jgi:phenylacetate-CoA ligase